MPNARGRPKGPASGGSRALAPIKNWKPWHEEVVGLHIMRWSNEAIAEKIGKTKQHVSNVLTDPKAQAVIRATAARFRVQLADDIDEKLLDLSVHAVERIKETIEFPDFPPGTDAKKHQDSISMSLLKGTGFLGTQVTESAPIQPLDNGLIKAFTDALAKSTEAASLQAKRDNGNEIPVLQAKVVA